MQTNRLETEVKKTELTGRSPHWAVVLSEKDEEEKEKKKMLW
jgi:hypothetical protein